MEKLSTKDLTDKFSIINGAKYFSLEIFQNYLVFIPAKRLHIFMLQPEFIHGNLMECQKKQHLLIIIHSLPNINFDGHCLIKNNILIHKKVIKLYISYTLSSQSKNFNLDFKLSNCLFGSVKLTKNTDLSKYKYTGYGIGFDSAKRIFFI